MNNLPYLFAAEDTSGAHDLRPQPGRGTRLTINSLGQCVSVATPAASFAHPFTPSLATKSISFSKGLVDSFEPTIKKIPISGADGVPQPALLLDPKNANANGESWACLEVEPNDQGVLTKDSRLEVVESNNPVSIDPKVGRVALALIVWRNQRPYRAFPIVYFNLRYQRVLPAAGDGAARHFFL